MKLDGGNPFVFEKDGGLVGFQPRDEHLDVHKLYFFREDFVDESELAEMNRLNHWWHVDKSQQHPNNGE